MKVLGFKEVNELLWDQIANKPMSESTFESMCPETLHLCLYIQPLPLQHQVPCSNFSKEAGAEETQNLPGSIQSDQARSTQRLGHQQCGLPQGHLLTVL